MDREKAHMTEIDAFQWVQLVTVQGKRLTVLHIANRLSMRSQVRRYHQDGENR